MDSSKVDAWTAYWQSGRIGSCFEGPDAELRLTQLWDEFVDELDDGARVLDLATGNGTVVRSCAARARSRDIRLRIEAIDAADINPAAHVADPQHYCRDVLFRGGVSLEALPCADATFDAVTSQFGFEYADENRAATEATRVLAPGGRLRLVTHARDGAVSRDIEQRLQRLQAVLAEHGAVTLVLDLARAAEAGDGATLERRSAQLAAAAEQVRRLAAQPLPDDSALFYAREFLRLWARRDRYWPADLRRSVEGGWRNASGVAIRQEQMLRAARSADDVARIRRRFADAGLVVEPAREIRDERRGVQIAWLIDARKPRGRAAAASPDNQIA